MRWVGGLVGGLVRMVRLIQTGGWLVQQLVRPTMNGCVGWCGPWLHVQTYRCWQIFLAAGGDWWLKSGLD